MEIAEINTITDAEKVLQYIVDDFDKDLSTKEETLIALQEFMLRLMEIFWENTKIPFKSNGEDLQPVLYELFKTYPKIEVPKNKDHQHVRYDIISPKLRIGFDYELQALIEKYSRK